MNIAATCEFELEKNSNNSSILDDSLEFLVTADANTNFLFNTIFRDSAGVGGTLITEYFTAIATMVLKSQTVIVEKRFNTIMKKASTNKETHSTECD